MILNSIKNLALKSIYFILASYARKVINRHHPFVIGITGSVGKGSAKEAIYQVLVDHFGDEVRKNYGNLNAEIGIPLTVLGYDRLPPKLLWPFFLIGAYFRTLRSEYPKYLILEMGVEHPGDISYFGSIVRLDIGIVTEISRVHVANFAKLDDLAKEKLSIQKIIKQGGTLIVNNDSSFLRNLDFDNVQTIGMRNKSEFMGEGAKITPQGTDFRIETTGQKIAIRSRMIGTQLIYASLFAFAVGKYFKIQSLEIKKSLEKIKPTLGRMNLIEGRNGTLIIDDSYNADPLSVKAALNSMHDFEWTGRRVAILGNMNSLGAYEESSHEEVARYAKECVDVAIFAGKNAELMKRSFGDNAYAFLNRKSAVEKIPSLVSKGDLILVKASQNGNFFEEVTKILMKDPGKAGELLVRQSNFWMRKK